jgi:hypothetical protein
MTEDRESIALRQRVRSVNRAIIDDQNVDRHLLV